jgi:hypothetical protein
MLMWWAKCVIVLSRYFIFLREDRIIIFQEQVDHCWNLLNVTQQSRDHLPWIVFSRPPRISLAFLAASEPMFSIVCLLWAATAFMSA